MQAFRATKSSTAAPVLSLQSVPIPRPASKQALVKIRASAVQPSDVLNGNGQFPQTTFPRTLGRDFAGAVVDGPPHLLNKSVFGTSGKSFSFLEDGAHAEYAVVPVDGVCLKPSSLDWVQAALVGVPCSTALQILQRSGLKAGESILVLGGTGSVGSWVSWLARAGSSQVITVGRHGTDIDSTKDPKLEAVAAWTNGRGVDVVVDTVGDVALIRAAIETMSVGGRLVAITAPRSGSTDVTFDLFSFDRRELSFLSCNTVEYTQAYMTRLLNDKLLPLLKGGTEGMPKVKATEISLTQAEEAYNESIHKAVIAFDS